MSQNLENSQSKTQSDSQDDLTITEQSWSAAEDVGGLSAGDRARCEALLDEADPARASVADYLERGRLYVAKIKSAASASAGSDGEIIGLYVNLPTRPLTIELVNVSVWPEFQGRGIGKRLVAHAIESARASGAKAIEIGTGSTGVAQLALYQKAGFRIVGIDRDYFTRFYPEPIYENGMRLRDMVRLTMDL